MTTVDVGIDELDRSRGMAAGDVPLEPAFWREVLAPYARPSLRRSIQGVLTSVLPYLILVAAMYWALDVSVLLVIAFGLPAAGFLVRTFIIFHDCSHSSYMSSKRANNWLGVVCGVLVYSPFHSWRHEHAIHHATAGDLDRRGRGDVETLTVAEYTAMSRGGRAAYRTMRNPLVMLGIGPLWALLLEPRLVPKWARARFGKKILATDLALAIVLGAMCLLLGWKAVLVVQLPTAMLAGAIGIWMFYVQHQFEDVYWVRAEDWTYAESALRGSSYLRLPKVFQFFTGNIGLHHVHHLSARIPNYNLQRAHDDNPIFHGVPTLNLWDAIGALRLKLYDEQGGRLIKWSDVRVLRTAPARA